MTDTVRDIHSRLMRGESIELRTYQDKETLEVTKWAVNRKVIAKNTYRDIVALFTVGAHIIEDAYTREHRKNFIHTHSLRIKEGR